VLAEARMLLAEVNPQSADEVRHAGRPVIRFSQGMFQQLKDVRGFLFTRVYRAPSVMEMRAQVTRVVNELFPAFLADTSLLPEDWRDDVAAAADETELARIVGDYIAGMTDRFALETHRKMFGG
ncbi:MAG: deoxyguanosinetriphosphate triphosphohydrolase, partial [Anaerolineae bacterium]|nr:deoxyguanosinetriphosphate triphosphohydrolase [Anaerolineae bacterium]